MATQELCIVDPELALFSFIIGILHDHQIANQQTEKDSDCYGVKNKKYQHSGSTSQKD